MHDRRGIWEYSGRNMTTLLVFIITQGSFVKGVGQSVPIAARSAPAAQSLNTPDFNSIRYLLRGNFVALGVFLYRDPHVVRQGTMRTGKAVAVRFYADHYRVLDCSDPQAPSMVACLHVDRSRPKGAIGLISPDPPLPDSRTTYLIFGSRSVTGVLRAEEAGLGYPLPADALEVKPDDVLTEGPLPTSARVLPKGSTPAFVYCQARLLSMARQSATCNADAMFLSGIGRPLFLRKEFDGLTPTEWLLKRVAPVALDEAEWSKSIDTRIVMSSLATQLHQRGAGRLLYSALQSKVESRSALSQEDAIMLRDADVWTSEVSYREFRDLARRCVDPELRRLLRDRGATR
jgi:hypothetical protein